MVWRVGLAIRHGRRGWYPTLPIVLYFVYLRKIANDAIGRLQMAAKELENSFTSASLFGRLGNRTYLFNHHAGLYPRSNDGTLNVRKSFKEIFSTDLESADALTESVAGVGPR